MLLVGLAGVGIWWLRSDPAAAPPNQTQADSPAVRAAPTSSRVPVTSAEVTDPILDALERAMAAWGLMAVSGDPTDLGDTFDSEGPQYLALTENPGGVGGDPYRVDVSPIEVIRGERRSQVRAEVVWSRPGETNQVFVWEIEMRRVEGDWSLWTVRDRQAP